MTGEAGFLSRWSRLKRVAATKEAAAEVAPRPTPESPVAPIPPALDDKELEARLAALPKLEEIRATTDIRPFMESWVPRALRDAALRRIWTSDPRIANFIEVADYQWDWNVPGGAPGCGPLEPDFDTTAFVKRLLGGGETSDDTPQEAMKSADSCKMDHTAPHHDLVLDPTPSSEFAGNDPKPELRGFPDRREPADNALSSPDQGDSALHQSPAQDPAPTPPRRPRHGGALPSA